MNTKKFLLGALAACFSVAPLVAEEIDSTIDTAVIEESTQENVETASEHVETLWQRSTKTPLSSGLTALFLTHGFAPACSFGAYCSLYAAYHCNACRLQNVEAGNRLKAISYSAGIVAGRQLSSALTITAVIGSIAGVCAGVKALWLLVRS